MYINIDGISWVVLYLTIVFKLMKKNLLYLSFALAMLATSCKKDDSGIEPVKDAALSDLVVPQTFSWQTSRDVNFSIGISDTRFQNKLYTIAIYMTDPGVPIGKVDGKDVLPKAVRKGSASLVSPYNTKLSIPAMVTAVYVVKTAADGSSFVQKVSVTSQLVSLSLGSSAVIEIPAPAAKGSAVENNKLTALTNTTSTFNTTPYTTMTEPSCGQSATGTSVSLSPFRVTCYTATANTTLNISGVFGGTLKISAPGKVITIGSFSHLGVSIFVGAGTTVKFPTDLNLSDGETIVNSGIVTGVNFTGNGNFTNHGTATFTGTINQYSSSIIVNNSVLDVKDVVAAGQILNTKTFLATGLKVTSSGTFTNNCYANIEGIVNNVDGLIKNNSLMVANNTYSTGNINLYDGALYQTDVFSQNEGYIYGIGEPSVFKVTSSVTTAIINNSGVFWGAVQYCGSRDINGNRLHFVLGAVQACGLYIPKDECNSVGNGTAPAPIKPDTDGDGVIDEQDDYPNDKTKAYNNYSANYQNGGSTVAFEDSWPSQGDYDLNDIVLTYKHMVITSAANIVVRVEGEWNLLATGGDYQNGAGILFPLPKANATNFTSSNGLPLEAGQDSVVVSLFSNSRALQTTWNTISGQAVSPSKSFTFSFDVTNGPSIAAMGVSSYNPFIWNNSTGFGRGYETHLYGAKPTKLAKASLFGTGADNSTTGVYYSTLTRLPWGIEIPVADFKYPVEYKPITVAYLKFNSWATSGGTNDKDWYSNTGSTYRNTSNLYIGK